MAQSSITFTSGSLSSCPRPGTAMLTAMRSAVEALAPALALELAPVRVNAITPGLMDTPLLHTAYGPERDSIVRNRAAILPGRRVSTADEVAQVILMLMTNTYMTGEVVHVDGGGRFV
jgi:NAD(P)-dependent dehydrogenase (short-subunit alcohol dehydrogenase family)